MNKQKVKKAKAKKAAAKTVEEVEEVNAANEKARAELLDAEESEDGHIVHIKIKDPVEPPPLGHPSVDEKGWWNWLKKHI